MPITSVDERKKVWAASSTTVKFKLTNCVLHRVEAWDTDNACTVDYVYLFCDDDTGKAQHLISKQDLGAGEVAAWQGELPIKGNWQVWVKFTNATAGDIVHGSLVIS